ncbi:unnamed protein product [Mytilus edulis]|uniref:DZIP3-like HEPN domain-containing protein n=1 Tax=Mytilus edulis TaxID=6550 RepID=A0A8S3PPK3_MYTED|nr:unnamed protein product [Mytilus edulis]
MASRLSQEEENYVRMCLLMTGISTRAARIVFDHSKTFDVTLMITLVKHLTDPKDLTPPRGGYGKLPLANETTPTSDLARIKFYRNFLAHLVEEKIEDTEFITAWDIVTDAISRLGGQPMKLECDKLKVKTLDQSNHEIILDIKRSNDEILELRKSVESLQKANDDLAKDVTKLKVA